jgi:uncharacterized protein
MVEAHRLLTVFFISFFPAILLAFHFRIYQMVFVAMFIQMISIVFLRHERSRMLMWCLIAFWLSYILILYGYRAIENLTIPIKLTLLLGECLHLIPIMAIYYVLKMFKQSPYLGLKASTQHLKIYKLAIAFTAVFLLFIIFFTQDYVTFLWAFIFCFVQAIVFEALWRGLLLELFCQFLNTYWTVLILGIAFGFYLLSFGHTLFVSMLMAVLSLGFSFIKLKTNNILPSILLHTIIVFLLFLSGLFFIPV